VQRGTAGHQYLEFWTVPQQIADHHGRDQEMLEVIQQQQRRHLAQILADRCQQRTLAGLTHT
jgi:hypothetical protein